MLTTLQRDGETSPRAVAEACSRRTDGVIDRSRCEILRGTQWSAQGRDPVWDSRRGTHLGSGHVWPRQQTEHMIAIASIHTLHSPCKPGAVHIWVPAFAGTSGDEKRFNLAGTCSNPPPLPGDQASYLI